MTVKSATGPVSYLRVHKVGTKYGPPQDQLDAEVIVKLKNVSGAYGFQLRADSNQAVGEAMVALLSDAFNANKAVTLEYEERPGKSNQPVLRVIRTT
jgi:hypothetical protein